ncbi:hypothetical protein [Homoserinibacter sp. YIM 151385]|uniref:hypothetical protein n=1 Tax=Homoserinibacter sp. YIM 151385 TaxID=2985506 RepID=UPI0022F00077|nr:hypothetical protein [Homoserinibacter sp. YIM 151385]WBU37830.1 hypothetical protein OF852_13060 [Homoserinibacter sp. YIM 151385]
MRSARALLPAAAVLLALAGCSAPAAEADPAEPADAEAPAETSAPSASAAGPASHWPSGAVAKRTGDIASLSLDGTTVATFSVEEISVDPSCTRADQAPSVNGHFIQLDLRVKTTAALEGTLDITAPAWSYVGDDGTVIGDVVGASATCLGLSKAMPTTVAAGETRNGAIVLDVPDAAGALILDLGGEQSWGYRF